MDRDLWRRCFNNYSRCRRFHDNWFVHNHISAVMRSEPHAFSVKICHVSNYNSFTMERKCMNVSVHGNCHNFITISRMRSVIHAVVVIIAHIVDVERTSRVMDMSVIPRTWRHMAMHMMVSRLVHMVMCRFVSMMVLRSRLVMVLRSRSRLVSVMLRSRSCLMFFASLTFAATVASYFASRILLSARAVFSLRFCTHSE